MDVADLSPEDIDDVLTGGRRRKRKGRGRGRPRATYRAARRRTKTVAKRRGGRRGRFGARRDKRGRFK
jgi:hypothetical protein